MRDWVFAMTGLMVLACGGGAAIDESPCPFPGPAIEFDPKWAAYPIWGPDFDTCESQADRVIYATRGDHFQDLRERSLESMKQLGWTEEPKSPSGYDPKYWTTNLAKGDERMELRVILSYDGEATSVALYVL